MLQRQKILRSKRGIETITAVLMLLLMFVFITVLIAVFFNINLNSQAMNTIDLQRSQERIILQNQTAGGLIESVIIYNEGPIEVKIMALYQDQDDVITFLGDPNTDYTTFQPVQTHIAPASSITISFQDGYEPLEGAEIIAATQRGTKSMDSSQSTKPTEPQTYPPTDLVIGPLILRFKEFQYQKTTGPIDPLAWKAGWAVPANIPCAWRIVITNIDERDITLSRYSGLSPVPNDFASQTTWFLEPTDSDLTRTLPAGEDSEIILMWSAPKNPSPLPNTVATIPPGGGKTSTCAIFLTFFGVYHEIDEFGEKTGELTPYAQTIPFEAVVVTK